MADIVVESFLIAVVVFILIVLLVRSANSIQPYQQGVVTIFGSYKRLINPGLTFISPVATVVRMDLRTQVLEVPRQEVITKDNSPTNVDAIIYIKVVDAPKAIFQVQDYHVATVALAQTTLRSIIGDMELDEVLYNRERIDTRLRDILDESTDRWGVRVEAVEIKEVDPVGPVKAAMEEQTSAERQRRAAVLRADGEKRSAILVAEGQKRSRILQAEGLRQSKILEAEGGRMATILEAQGESQRLRILSLGAGTLDAKALTVLSLDTVSNLGDGPGDEDPLPVRVLAADGRGERVPRHVPPGPGPEPEYPERARGSDREDRRYPRADPAAGGAPDRDQEHRGRDQGRDRRVDRDGRRVDRRYLGAPSGRGHADDPPSPAGSDGHGLARPSGRPDAAGRLEPAGSRRSGPPQEAATRSPGLAPDAVTRAG